MRAAGGKPLYEQPIEEVRANIRGASRSWRRRRRPWRASRIAASRWPGGDIGVRIYTPRPLRAGTRCRSCCSFTAAGWVAGDLDTHDSIARYYSAHADAIVVAVDYRRPPEHKFPAAVDDPYAAVEWAVAHAREIGGDAGAASR